MEPLAAEQHAELLEVRGLEKHRLGRGRHLGLLAAHDPGDGDGPLGVRDHELLGRQLPLGAVERADALAGAGAAHDDPALRERGVVEGVERAAEREHHVVGHVDDVRDRAHAGAEQARLEPRRGLADRHVAEEPPDVARAALEVLDADVDRLVAGALGLAARRGREVDVEQRRHLTGDAVDARQVGPVVARLDLEHGVRERQDVGERRARLERGVEEHDPRVVRAELDLVLREDHPVRQLAAHLPLLELEAVRDRGAGERHRDGRARAEVPRAADDLPRVALPHVDLAELQPVRVRVLDRLEDAADEEASQVAVRVRNAAMDDPVDLAAREHEPTAELLDRQVEADVLAQPGDGDLHRTPQNCSSTRTSFSQNRRRSGRPCRSMAMRSIPRPNAKPVHSSGS